MRFIYYKITLLFICVSLIFSGFGVSAEDSGRAKAKQILLVVDVSGSMIGPKMENLMKGLQAVIKACSAEHSIAIAPFSTEANREMPSFVKCDEPGRERLSIFIEDELIARGGTNYEDALDYAGELLAEQTGRVNFIFITDGKATFGERDPALLSKKLAKLLWRNIYGRDYKWNFLSIIGMTGAGKNEISNFLNAFNQDAHGELILIDDTGAFALQDLLLEACGLDSGGKEKSPAVLAD